ncbi:MAG: SOS response-associated peptidase [Alphaproteobacteria bacterium]|nr:SOS response-associated peptidase [Alphaproteobacteria bacterium]
MCGRTVLYANYDELRGVFGLTNNINFGPSYNIAPSQDMPIIIGHEARLAKWGYIPEWAKGKEIKSQINARAETAHEKPFFRSGFKHRRCLVPINGFFEWETLQSGKQPWYFTQENKILAIAGIFNAGTFCLLTKQADGVVAQIHDRMPVLVSPGQFMTWCEGGEAEAKTIIENATGNALTGRTVSAKINSPKNNGPEFLE